VSPPVAPASEAEELWRLARRLERRVEELERRDDLEPLRVELRDLAREVAALGAELRGLLRDDRAGLVEVLTHAAPPPVAPVASLGPPREVRVQVWRAAAAALAALGTGLALGLAALLRGC